jgi:IS605 OrfB family transposase
VGYTSFVSDVLTRTVCVKLDVRDHAAVLSETAAAFNAAATWIARVCWEEGITNSMTAHFRVYGETRRRFGLGAQLAECARAKAMEALKAVRKKDGETCPTFGPQGSVRYDARTYRLLPLDDVTLNTLHGRVVCRLKPGPHQRAMLLDEARTIGGAELVQRRGTWYLHIVQHAPAPVEAEPTGYLGVDLGIVNVATDSTGEPFTGEALGKTRERRFRHRQSLQVKNTRRARARLRRCARREARFQRDINHIVSKALVGKAVASCKALALEDLNGIRERVNVRHEQRRQHSAWAFSQLRLFVAYKARAAGVRVVYVDPRNTSRTCSACGYCDKRNRVDQAHFRCLQCGFTANADSNGALNIAHRAAVNRPIVLPPLDRPAAIASTSPPALAVGR